MNFIRKSLAMKAAIVLFLALAVLLLIYFGLQALHISFLGGYEFVFFFVVFFVIAAAIVFFTVHRPLSVVFQEMKALLTGHSYKKIFTQRIDEVGVLAHFFNEVTRNIERISADVEEGKRMSQELAIGSDIQRRILPKEMPQIPGLVIFGNMRPASEVGGDSFDIIQTPLNALVYVGDVTGHGLPAALIMVMVNTMIRTYSELYQSGYDIITHTNRILKQRIEPRRFMTCVLLRFNIQEQQLFYTGAGHEHILIFHKAEGVCEVKQTGGIALGMVPDIAKIVREEVIPLQKGDKVILYSDGIIEAKNMQGMMFGIQNLKLAIEKYAARCTPEELFTELSKEFGAFVGDQIQEDDITLIVLERV